MQELIEAIRVAVTSGATAEQKSIGAQACRTILTALDAEPGKPIVLPGAPTPSPLAGLTLDQALDLAIARLRAIAPPDAPPDTPTAPPARASSERPGVRMSFVRPPVARGSTKPRPR